jgi:hypothetical protein
MSNQHENLLLSNDEYQPPPAWWSPSDLLTPEVTSITAFTIALISISTFGAGSSMLVAQSVLGAPAGPSDLRVLNLITAVILLGMALGAFLLARRVFRQAEPWCAQWPAPGRRGGRHRGAKRRAEHCGTHRSAAPPRARRRPCPDPARPPHLMEDDDVRFPVRFGTACHRGCLGAGPGPEAAAPAPRPRGRHAVAGPGCQGVRERANRQVDVTRRS